MTEERIEELHTTAFKLVLASVSKNERVDFKTFIRTVAAEARREGINDFINAVTAHTQLPWLMQLFDTVVAQLKEDE